MCGIVGYIGSKPASEILIGGLRRLEYRGYDSSGIVTIGTSGATLSRAKGKVAELAKKVPASSIDSIGIGHTRWATHGVPSESNAHPHKAGDIYLVHNGIIENYKELRAELPEHFFASETDSEVLAALIDSFYSDNVSLESAVSQALQLVIGTYGIAVVSTRSSEIVVARSGSPLIIGVGDGEIMIASDASALIGYTTQAIYLGDGELAVCRADGVQLRNLNAQVLTPKLEELEGDLAAIQKQGYDHFLLKEIMEQPTTLRSTLSGRVVPEANRAQLGGLNLSDDQLRDVQHIIIVGCGTAYYAGQLASYYIEQLTDVTVEVQVASELRYRSFNVPEGSIALVVSQSGETADTLACLRELKQRGVTTLGIINAVGSTIAREVDGGVYVHAGPEISVASTKAFTSQVSAMVILAIQVAQVQGISPQNIASYISELARLPSDIEAVLASVQDDVKQAAEKYATYDHALFLGRNHFFPVAMEGALKLKEISYIQAEGYAAGELKHGPIALLDDRFFEVILLHDDWLIDKNLSSLAEVNARSGHVLAITTSARDIEAEHIIRIETKADVFAPLVINVVQQLFAYYVTVAKGYDVDQPRNLAKSVTVE